MPAKKGVPRVYLEALLLTVLAATFARTFLVQGVRISSGSMQDALLEGDHVLVNRFVFRAAPSRLLPSRLPRRGEVVAHRYPPAPQTLLVKRVIGLPGENVEVREGTVYIDGAPLDESAWSPAADRASAEVGRLGDSELFVMGDRRDDSHDSRAWGPVRRGQLVGKPLFVYWSWRSRAQEGDGPLTSLLGFLRHAPSHTRWERTGLRVR
jgi:signal peptidase I